MTPTQTANRSTKRLFIGLDIFSDGVESRSEPVSSVVEIADLIGGDLTSSNSFECRTLVSNRANSTISASTIQSEIHRALCSEVDVAWIHFVGNSRAVKVHGDIEVLLIAEDGSSLRLNSLWRVLAVSQARCTIVTLDCRGSSELDEQRTQDFIPALAPNQSVLLSIDTPDPCSRKSQHIDGLTSHLLRFLSDAAAEVSDLQNAQSLSSFLLQSAERDRSRVFIENTIGNPPFILSSIRW